MFWNKKANQQVKEIESLKNLVLKLENLIKLNREEINELKSENYKLKNRTTPNIKSSSSIPYAISSGSSRSNIIDTYTPTMTYAAIDDSSSSSSSSSYCDSSSISSSGCD